MSILENKIINIDYDAEVARIIKMMKEYLLKVAHRRGFVVAISGGIDSSACAALAVEAVGKDRVLFLRLPESDSSSSTGGRSKALADLLGSSTIDQNITDVLSALGCYEWRDNAIREIYPDYGDGWKNKIVIEGGLEGQYNHFNIVVEDPDGQTSSKRMNYRQYLQVVAATNYKQRMRKSIEYFHADRMNYAVVGTPNYLEYDQGFFVKNGDGSADVKPIAHLYKSQVYAMAKHLGLPEEICNAVPTTDTYSLAQGQDEFYFALPYQQMDVALWCYNQQLPAAELASELAISEDRAEYVYKDIEAKRQMTRYLVMNPQKLDV
jgi:NAD+ synthase